MVTYCFFETPIGWIGVAGGPRGLIRVTLPRTDRRSAAAEVRAGLGRSAADEAAFPEVRAEFARYFAGDQVAFDLPLDDGGLGEFLRRVYAACRAIPPGEVLTYADLARAAGGDIGAARAVGRAMATNPWPIVVPCHRVVGSDGTLRGYGGGLPMKAALLAFERGQPLEYDPTRPVPNLFARQLALLGPAAETR